MDAGDGSVGRPGACRAGGAHVRSRGDVPRQVLLRHRVHQRASADHAAVQRSADENPPALDVAAEPGARAPLDAAAVVVVVHTERPGRHPEGRIRRGRRKAPVTSDVRRRARRVSVPGRRVRVGGERLAPRVAAVEGVAAGACCRSVGQWPRDQRAAPAPAAAAADARGRRSRRRPDPRRVDARSTRGAVPSFGVGAGDWRVGLVFTRAGHRRGTGRSVRLLREARRDKRRAPG